jgi:dTDP-4-dehydrorhamnose 3,5-epimerase
VKALPGVLHGTIAFETVPNRDGQAGCLRVFDSEVAEAAGLDPRSLVQETQSRAPRGMVRGLHLRTDGGQGLLVRCSYGAVVDVAVDLRPGSPTYRMWMTLVLDDVDHRSVWLPAGLAHGYQALTEVAVVCCRANRMSRPEFDATIRYYDLELAVPWPLPVTDLTEQDRKPPVLAVVEPMLSDWFGALR